VRNTSTRSRKGNVGWDKVLSVGAESSKESYVQRSVLDSLFPELETVLEDGWLIDISEEFTAGESSLPEIRALRPEGSLFRLTASGFVFNPEQFLQTMTQFSSLVGGLEMMQSVIAEAGGTSTNSARSKDKHRGSQPSSARYRSLPGMPVAEDFVEQF
jgi:hypothetical protein